MKLIISQNRPFLLVRSVAAFQFSNICVCSNNFFYISKGTSRGPKWGNKTNKLERSISTLERCKLSTKIVYITFRAFFIIKGCLKDSTGLLKFLTIYFCSLTNIAMQFLYSVCTEIWASCC